MNPTSDSGEREFLNIISTQALNRLASYMTSDSAVSREYHPCYTYLKYQFKSDDYFMNFKDADTDGNMN